ncbi:MAG: hypothetical protein ACXWP6_05120 [Ktedonobacterales bacterium]
MDEFDIEMTNLRNRPAATDLTTGDPTDHSGHATSELAQSVVRAPLGKRLSRLYLFRALAVVLTILLPLAIILGANPNLRAAIDSLLHPVTTFANSTAPGSEQFDLVHITPWGDMHIDGQAVPRNYVLQRFRAVKLAPGTHTLDYNAPPFAPLHCILTVPADPASDTCPLTQNADDLYPIQNDTVRMLDLRAGFNNLSGQQLATLIKAAEVGLATGSPTATIDFGEHYLAVDGEIVANTSRPMRATLLYHLSTNPPHVLPGFPPLQCSPLCFNTHLFEQAPNEWGVLAPVVLSWSYAVPHGPVVSGPIDPAHDTLDAGIPLHITWQHGWRVTPLKFSQLLNASQADSPICVPAQDALDWALAPIPGSGYEYSMRPAPDATSCLIEGDSMNSATTTSWYLLYRFGVLLAANDQAHSTFPTLPLASTSEQALAQQLAAQG